MYKEGFVRRQMSLLDIQGFKLFKGMKCTVLAMVLCCARCHVYRLCFPSHHSSLLGVHLTSLVAAGGLSHVTRLYYFFFTSLVFYMFISVMFPIVSRHHQHHHSDLRLLEVEYGSVLRRRELQVGENSKIRKVRQSARQSLVLRYTFDPCRELESDRQCWKARATPLRASYSISAPSIVLL